MGRMMRKLVFFLAAAFAACQPPSEPVTAHEASDTPTEASPPSRPAVSEWQRLECATSLVINSQTDSSNMLVAMTEWSRKTLEVLDQFKFTPWQEIPEDTKPRVVEYWREVHNRSLAKRAIELQVPVSSLGCTPEAPDCFDFPTDQAGMFYVSVLNTEMARVLNVAKDSYERADVMAGLFRRNVEHFPVWKELADQTGRQQKVVESFTSLLKMFPRSALLPRWQWPPAAETPSECKPILGR